MVIRYIWKTNLITQMDNDNLILRALAYGTT
ncbi:unnamed protein product, partial [marine sediment metagenome]